ncbi:hypothetical protein QOZ80_9AG0691020 [Eleusine coracana subsp. coracana]|nr:hypothetical protein QOZ80_9AG0691020 [Eleusine coracana subsp. coracana]
MADAVDRLSDLPDDLLRHVLHFTPTKEAASTTALSRRWRPLWPTSSHTVNLDTRSHDATHGAGFSFPKRDAFLRCADAALSAAAAAHHHHHHHGDHHGPVRRLTVHVEAGSHFTARMFTSLRGKHDLVAAVLAHPAARRGENLRVSAAHTGQASVASSERDDDTALYKLNAGSLPSEALRSLHVVRGELIASAAPSAVFPWLTRLRLEECTASLHDLQAVIDAAPQLDVLHLENCSVFRSTAATTGSTTTTGGTTITCLRCPTVTVLVMEKCRWVGWEEGHRVLIDMPRLRSQYVIIRLHPAARKAGQIAWFSTREDQTSPRPLTNIFSLPAAWFLYIIFLNSFHVCIVV